MTPPRPQRPSVGMSEANDPNPARLVAEIQSITLALRIGGLDGLRSGRVRTATTNGDSGFPQ